MNYISFAGYDPAKATRAQPTEFRDRWPARHVIGKDILVPAHGVYWPIMLHALGFTDAQMPHLLVHGWWNIAGAKMSKSARQHYRSFALPDSYGPEALRYYLMSDIAIGKDADFSADRLEVYRYKFDLADTLGNLLNRSLPLTKYIASGVARPAADYAISGNPERLHIEETISNYVRSADRHSFDEACLAVFG